MMGQRAHQSMAVNCREDRVDPPDPRTGGGSGTREEQQQRTVQREGESDPGQWAEAAETRQAEVAMRGRVCQPRVREPSFSSTR